ncbi:MAG: type I-B CRISPR-associated protein Cas7/Cst2/DevR [Syntrophorhabdaceae bacterium]|nr:type I-B CRISPR-associated protein Cas7/Cst2/DevR [Syntrophorhabdaceae bacterium]
MKIKGLTVTVITEAMSLNYGESLGNISELKKITKNGGVYSYLSPQAMRYEIYRALRDNFAMDSGKAEALHTGEKVIQFRPDVTIKDYIEADLFGYMKTKKKKGKKEEDDQDTTTDGGATTRVKVARTSPAVSLAPFRSDMEFGTNKNFADRTGDHPDPFQFEHHHSPYAYTLTVNLDRVGVDLNSGIELPGEERVARVCNLLEVLKILNREIKGRTESLNPLFIIGGAYPVKNPWFLNRTAVNYNKESGKWAINTDVLRSVANLNFKGIRVGDYTRIGYLKGWWDNEAHFGDIVSQAGDLNWFFETLKDEVMRAYETSQG